MSQQRCQMAIYTQKTFFSSLGLEKAGRDFFFLMHCSPSTGFRCGLSYRGTVCVHCIYPSTLPFKPNVLHSHEKQSNSSCCSFGMKKYLMTESDKTTSILNIKNNTNPKCVLTVILDLCCAQRISSQFS